MDDRVLVVSLSGRRADVPFSSFMGVLSSGQLLDVRHHVIDEVNTVTAVFPMEGQDVLLRDILFKANEKGMETSFSVVGKKALISGELEPLHSTKFAVTVLVNYTADSSAPLRFLASVTRILTSYSANIASIQRLSDSDDALLCYEFIVELPDARDEERLRVDLLQKGRDGGNVALQKAGLQLRSKRLVVFDLSWTIIKADAMDVMCKAAGVPIPTGSSESREEKTIDGISYFKSRAKLLRSASREFVASTLSKHIQYTDGAADLCRVLRKMGYKIGLISSGAQLIADHVKRELDLDFAYGNGLEIDDDGHFTGEVRQPVVDASRKAELFQMLCMQERITADLTVAIGDGPVSSTLLASAGLSVAYDQPETTSEDVAARISNLSLTTVLYFMGISSKDIRKLLSTS